VPQDKLDELLDDIDKTMDLLFSKGQMIVGGGTNCYAEMQPLSQISNGPLPIKGGSRNVDILLRLLHLTSERINFAGKAIDKHWWSEKAFEPDMHIDDMLIAAIWLIASARVAGLQKEDFSEVMKKKLDRIRSWASSGDVNVTKAKVKAKEK